MSRNQAEPAPRSVVETCPACKTQGADGARLVADHEYGLTFRARYARCTACHSEYQSPMPAADALASFYPPTYHSMTAGGLLQRMRHDVRLRRLHGLWPRRGVLLDYGCGAGAFLLHAAARASEMTLWGYEIAPTRTVERLADGAITIIRGSVGDLLAELPPCGLITMNHVIEHLPDPVAVVGALAERLVPGGVLEGQTPAVGSLEHRVFGERWSGYHAPRHTVVFSPQGLVTLCERAGLQDVTTAGAFNPAGLALSLASVPHGGAPGVLPRHGWRWFGCLALAVALAPADLWVGPPAVLDFAARRPESAS